MSNTEVRLATAGAVRQHGHHRTASAHGAASVLRCVSVPSHAPRPWATSSDSRKMKGTWQVAGVAVVAVEVEAEEAAAAAAAAAVG